MSDNKFKDKYFKYKSKYLKLIKQIGGERTIFDMELNNAQISLPLIMDKIGSFEQYNVKVSDNSTYMLTLISDAFTAVNFKTKNFDVSEYIAKILISKKYKAFLEYNPDLYLLDETVYKNINSVNLLNVYRLIKNANNNELKNKIKGYDLKEAFFIQGTAKLYNVQKSSSLQSIYNPYMKYLPLLIDDSRLQIDPANYTKDNYDVLNEIREELKTQIEYVINEINPIIEKALEGGLPSATPEAKGIIQQLKQSLKGTASFQPPSPENVVSSILIEDIDKLYDHPEFKSMYHNVTEEQKTRTTIYSKHFTQFVQEIYNKATELYLLINLLNNTNSGPVIVLCNSLHVSVIQNCLESIKAQKIFSATEGNIQNSFI